MLKNIIFDFGGVVCGYNPDQLISDFYSDEDHALAKAAIHRNWPALDEGTVDYQAYADETAALLPERLRETTRQFFRHWYKHMPPIEATWALIGRLQARGYRCYLLSNACAPFANELHLFPILRALDGAIVSATIQMVKPNAEIYQYALKKFDVEASETLFVDDMPANVEAARACGLYGYRYTEDADALLAYIEALSKGGRP